MFDNLDEFNKLMGQVESNSGSAVPDMDFSAYNLGAIHEGILQKGINRFSNLLGDKIKSKISNEWKHLDEDGRQLLVRIIFGDESIFSEDNEDIDVALARAFKDKTLTATNDQYGNPSIVLNQALDLSNTSAKEFPDVTISKVDGDIKCSYSSFSSFKNFPESANSLEFVKGKSKLVNLVDIPDVTGINPAKYSLDMKYTKIDSLSGWMPTGMIKGHVSFRGCDIKNFGLSKTIFITGILDIRENPNLTIEAVKAVVLKDYSKGRIIAKGGIYHSFEVDDIYDPEDLTNENFINDSLGALTEATGEKKAKLVKQEELWQIGDQIVKYMESKAPTAQGTPVENISAQIRPDIQNLVSDMASSQLSRESVSTANKQITQGMTSEEFKKLMDGLFGNLLKQLTEMIRGANGGSSEKVDATIESVTNAIAETASEKVERIADDISNKLNADECVDWNSVKETIATASSELPEVAKKPLKVLGIEIDSLISAKTSDDRGAYSLAIENLFKELNGNILAKPIPSPNEVSKMVTACFGEEEKPVEPATDATAEPVTDTATETPLQKATTDEKADNSTPLQEKAKQISMELEPEVVKQDEGQPIIDKAKKAPAKKAPAKKATGKNDYNPGEFIDSYITGKFDISDADIKNDELMAKFADSMRVLKTTTPELLAKKAKKEEAGELETRLAAKANATYTSAINKLKSAGKYNQYMMAAIANDNIKLDANDKGFFEYLYGLYKSSNADDRKEFERFQNIVSVRDGAAKILKNAMTQLDVKNAPTMSDARADRLNSKRNRRVV